MNAYSVFLPVLFCTLVVGIIALLVLLPNKKDSNRYEKISTISSFMTSIAAIIIGIVTVSIMKKQKDDELSQNQPIFIISHEEHSDEDGVLINEEFSIINVGERVRSIRKIESHVYLQLYYNDHKNNAFGISKLLPITEYFNSDLKLTGNPDDIVAYSMDSGNNLAYFHQLEAEAREFEKKYTDVIFTLTRRYYYVIRYTDIYGNEKETKYYMDKELDSNGYEKYRASLYDEPSYLFSVSHFSLTFNQTLQILFPDLFV